MANGSLVKANLSKNNQVTDGGNRQRERWTMRKEGGRQKNAETVSWEIKDHLYS